jgi:glucose/mannose-6-phosphate isomerase
MSDGEKVEEKHYQLDRSKMIDLVAGFPGQLREALETIRSFDPEPLRKEYADVTVCGMGGSAIGGDLVRSVLGREVRVPLAVSRHYNVPGYVGPRSLVVLSSYSGNTEETLEAYDAAKGAGATLAVLTTGGRLARKAEEDGTPQIRIPREGLPPRAALAYSFVPLLGLLARLQLAPDLTGELEDSIPGLESHAAGYGLDIPLTENQAKQLASKLYGKLPVIYTGSGTVEAVGLRWKGQFNENSKSPAYIGVFPELNHNEIMGWDEKRRILGDFFVMVLRDPDDHPRVRRRMDITAELVRPVAGGYVEFEGSGSGALARVLSLVTLGDFTSVYLAIHNGVDPTPVEKIEQLKAALAKN